MAGEIGIEWLHVRRELPARRQQRYRALRSRQGERRHRPTLRPEGPRQLRDVLQQFPQRDARRLPAIRPRGRRRRHLLHVSGTQVVHRRSHRREHLPGDG
jgi:hypothetical protein